jgi:hypothetical protein
MPVSLSEDVQLRGPVYHYVVYVNNECLGWENY